jgi:hypothetical protein
LVCSFVKNAATAGRHVSKGLTFILMAPLKYRSRQSEYPRTPETSAAYISLHAIWQSLCMSYGITRNGNAEYNRGGRADRMAASPGDEDREKVQ